MEFLNSILENSSIPIITAFVLGLMTAISPCPLATNITAIGYISRELENKKRVFINGLIYTLGRAISYTTLGLLFYFGASQFHIARFFQTNGEKFLGPLLIIFGILMFDFIRIPMPGFSKLSDKIGHSEANRTWVSLLLGIIFALAFCPFSGVIYFGMLIPLTIASAKGLYLPIVFAIATGLPVIIIAWLIAFTVSGVGSFYNKVKTFEKWFKRVVAILFIGVGIYYLTIFFFK
ncbi:MAG: sulfite exporter TauE/SafE family protein [Sphingobacteriales bacterium]|nr:sulfite exporter TauE/SafE family protein [Sphingobacteriales bacterium]